MKRPPRNSATSATSAPAADPVTVNDFPRYLHLHRVRTVLQLIEPYAVADPDFPIEEIVNDLREVPAIAHRYAGERDRDRELPPWDYGLQAAVRHAHFHEMTRVEVRDIIKDVTWILRHGYGDFIRAPDDVTPARHPTRTEPRWFWRP